jgi:hypothetical protein
MAEIRQLAEGEAPEDANRYLLIETVHEARSKTKCRVTARGYNIDELKRGEFTHAGGAIRQRPFLGEPRRAATQAGLSKRGQQSHLIEPSRDTRAAVSQSPMRPSGCRPVPCLTSASRRVAKIASGRRRSLVAIAIAFPYTAPCCSTSQEET